MFRKTSVLIAFLLALILSGQVLAQDGIPDSKRKLIAELMELTDTKNQVVEITDRMLAAMETVYPSIIRKTMNSDLLTDEENDAFAEYAAKRYKAFSKKFRERLPQVVDYGEYVEKHIYPLYDQYFTEDEIADLIAFYKTPTGQKAVKTLPSLMSDSMRLADQYLTPKFTALVKEILAEESQQKGPPPPAAPVRKKG